MNVIQNDAMIMSYRLSTSYFTPFCHESDNVFWQKNNYASFSNVFFLILIINQKAHAWI
jgi:hypothetical protein